MEHVPLLPSALKWILNWIEHKAHPSRQWGASASMAQDTESSRPNSYQDEVDFINFPFKLLFQKNQMKSSYAVILWL